MNLRCCPSLASHDHTKSGPPPPPPLPPSSPLSESESLLHALLALLLLPSPLLPPRPPPEAAAGTSRCDARHAAHAKYTTCRVANLSTLTLSSSSTWLVRDVLLRARNQVGSH